MKKILLLATLICAILSGCQKTNEGANGAASARKDELSPEKIGYYSSLKLPIDDKGTEIKMTVASNINNLNDLPVVKELNKRTGLNVTLIPFPSNLITEKMKVILASKQNMPDIVNGIYNIAMANDLGMQGAFIKIDEHLDELPNLKEVFYTKAKENKIDGEINKYIAFDGHLYLFPRFDTAREVNHGILYRKDIFDKHNIPMWNSSEEFYQALKKLKGIYPESLPFVSKNKDSIFLSLSQSWGILFPDPYFDEESNTWKHSTTDVKAKDMLDYIKRLYNEKLIDPEFLTDTQAQWTSKMTQKEKAFTTFDWISRLDMFKEQTAQTVPEYDLRYGYPIGPTGKVITVPRTNDGPSVLVGKNSLLSLKLLDYLISPSGAQLTTLGIENETFQFIDNGREKVTYIGFENKIPSITNLEEKYGLFIGDLYRRMDRRSAYFNFTEREQEAHDIMKNKAGGGFLPSDPIICFNEEETKKLNEIHVNLKKAANEFAMKYILTNETGDTAWQAWIAQANSLGANEMTNIYNNAYIRQMEKEKQ